MEKMTFQQIYDLLNSQEAHDEELDPTIWFHEGIYHETINNTPGFECLGNVKMVHQHGGEGEGDQYYTIYHFIDHDIYVKFDGWYASYHGSEYEEMYQVEPVQVMVTQYNRVK